ncbi:MAG: hypothetical protein JKY96_04430 [Phycisphaerales bacterium]|nr:hypothetical protein [Phycisphaerales bacterium]
MANPDRPRGFTPIKHTSGSAVTGQIRAIGVTDGTDLFVGDMLNLASGLAVVGATNDSSFLGVAVGFGKIDPMTGSIGSAANPVNLNIIYYDDSASTHTDYVVFYVPARDMIFEVQSNADLDLAIGDPCDLVATAGSTTTGLSLQEVGISTNSDFVLVEIPDYVDNDSTLTNTRYFVQVTQTETAFD